MPRHARLDVPGTLHHVMARGIEGTTIFADDTDRLKFLSGLEDLSSNFSLVPHEEPFSPSSF